MSVSPAHASGALWGRSRRWRGGVAGGHPESVFILRFHVLKAKTTKPRPMCRLILNREQRRPYSSLTHPLTRTRTRIQSHMAQKPVLRGEVGCACVAREVGVERGGMGERGCARRPLTHPLSQATSCVFRITPHYTKRQNSLRYLCGSRPLKGTALRAGPRWLHPS